MPMSGLVSELEAALPAMAPGRVRSLGFAGMVEHPDRAGLQRSAARAVLLAERVLEELPTTEPVVLMKGLEVACLYPAPQMRSFRDVDVLTDEADALWQALSAAGFQHRLSRRQDIDHHHLPALRAPYGAIAIEVHHRPNVPAWASIDPDLILSTAEASRTGISGVLRPRDDLHALLLAFHAWKSGFSKPRDLYDAQLLAAVSEIRVEETAKELGLARFWRWTETYTRAIFLDDRSAAARLGRLIAPLPGSIRNRRRTRVIAPFLVKDPVTVVRGHVADYRLGREARRSVSGVVQDVEDHETVDEFLA